MSETSVLYNILFFNCLQHKYSALIFHGYIRNIKDSLKNIVHINNKTLFGVTPQSVFPYRGFRLVFIC